MMGSGKNQMADEAKAMDDWRAREAEKEHNLRQERAQECAQNARRLDALLGSGALNEWPLFPNKGGSRPS